MEIDILTGSILIGLFLTNVILILLDRCQQSTFRNTLLEKIEEVEHLQHYHHQTEKHLQDALLEKIEEVEHLQHRHHQTEKHLQDKLLEKIEEVNLLQCRQQSTLQQTEIRLRDTLLEKIEEVEPLLKQYRTSTLFDYQSPWWQDYSWLYRHVRGWQCEECQLSLNLDRQYLHTHHISGTQHNDPNDLKALCIACHSEQPGTNHERLESLQDYQEFMERYGEQWRLLKDYPPLTS